MQFSVDKQGSEIVLYTVQYNMKYVFAVKIRIEIIQFLSFKMSQYDIHFKLILH